MQKLICLLFGVIGFLGQVGSAHFLAQNEVSWVAPPQAGEKWDPGMTKILSFGNLPVVIDWLFLQCLTDYTHNVKPTGFHSAFYYTVDLLTSLDPFHFDAYPVAGKVLNIVQKDALGAQDILRKGIAFSESGLLSYPLDLQKEFWSESWQIPILLGYTYLFELKDMPNAALEFQRAASISGAPAYLSRLDQKFKQPGGQYSVGLRLLNFMIGNAEKDELREGLEKKIKDLTIAQDLFKLNESFKTFLKGVPPNQQLFARFSQHQGLAVQDPWGGKFFMNSEGRIDSTVERELVFGIK